MMFWGTVFAIAFFSFVGYFWYKVILLGGEVLATILRSVNSATRERESSRAPRAVSPDSKTSQATPTHGTSIRPAPIRLTQKEWKQFERLLTKSAKPGLDPIRGNPLWLDSLKHTAMLAVATKAAYYYSIGMYSSPARMLKHITVESVHDESLHHLLLNLIDLSQGESDIHGAGLERPLVAGDSAQAPYSYVLFAVENGHFDPEVMEALKLLVRKQWQ
jgi:hypothetical protein